MTDSNESVLDLMHTEMIEQAAEFAELATADLNPSTMKRLRRLHASLGFYLDDVAAEIAPKVEQAERAA